MEGAEAEEEAIQADGGAAGVLLQRRQHEEEQVPQGTRRQVSRLLKGTGSVEAVLWIRIRIILVTWFRIRIRIRIKKTESASS
jgi:hypothetical protein